MGRHARGATRSPVSLSTLVLGALVLIVIAVGTYLSSRAQPSTIAATEVRAQAVVVSSLACGDGADGGTLVDVLNPAGMAAGSTVRASLDACGYQEGVQLAVLHPAGDPTRVTLASQDPGAVTDAGLLPYGLGAAGLLGAGAALAVWLDGRRVRRGWHAAGGRRRPPAERDGSGAAASHVLAVIGRVVAPITATTAELPAITLDRPSGRHARPDVEEPAGAPEANVVVPRRSNPSPAVVEPSVDSGLGERPQPPVDLVFPITSSLAASLHDELFTHRSVST